jgi:hypothetical protein
MRPVRLSSPKVVAAASAVLASLALGGPALAATTTSPPTVPFKARVILNGALLKHSYIPSGSTTKTPKTETLSKPDDITALGGDLFTAFQNGVGPQGEPSTDGNTASTVVEFTKVSNKWVVVHQWDVTGKVDGLTADPGAGLVIATVNEDANSSIYTIKPGAKPGHRVQHYTYSKNPLTHNGGTDAISIYRGHVLVSASAPGTVSGSPAAPNASYPAVYSVVFNSKNHVATVRPLFYDEAKATVANRGTSLGKRVSLALTDPDSNEVVPATAHRFAADFMLTSQGDLQQIFLQPSKSGSLWIGRSLHVLTLAQSVDDTAWATARGGRLFATDSTNDTVDVVTGPFNPGSVIVAVTPCGANSAPATCPAPPTYPANYLGLLNPWTGHVAHFPALSGAAAAKFTPQGGLLFIG